MRRVHVCLVLAMCMVLYAALVRSPADTTRRSLGSTTDLSETNGAANRRNVFTDGVRTESSETSSAGESTDEGQTDAVHHRQFLLAPPSTPVPTASQGPSQLLTFDSSFPEGLATRIRRYVEPELQPSVDESSRQEALATFKETPVAHGEDGVASITTGPRDDGLTFNGSYPSPRVEFLVCVRGWLYDFLHAGMLRSKASGSHIPRNHTEQLRGEAPPAPRFKMGEVRTWSALLASLSVHSCNVVLQKECHGLIDWAHVPPQLHDRDNRAGVVRVFLTEDLSLDHLRRVRHRPGMCQARSRQTIAVAGAASKHFPNDRVLPLFHIKEHNRSVGLVADCGGALPDGTLVSPRTGQPRVAKKWYAVLWGKAKQVGRNVMDAVAIVSRFIPVVSSCITNCDSALPTARLRGSDVLFNNLTTGSTGDVTNFFGRAVKHAVLLVGVQAPERGAACPEALACGTYVVARGRHLGYEFSGHPLTRRFRKLDQLERYVREILVDVYGFNASLPFDAQPHPPQPLRGWAPLRHSFGGWRPLPLRYSRRGHAAHAALVLGLDETCRIRRDLRVSWVRDANDHSVPIVRRSIGAPPEVGSALVAVLGPAATKGGWQWSGC